MKFYLHLVLFFLLATWVAPLRAEPAWLSQVEAQKSQQPEAMLALLQQHQSELATLSRPQQAKWYYLQAALFDALGRHQQQQDAAEQGLRLIGDDASLVRVQAVLQVASLVPS